MAMTLVHGPIRNLDHGAVAKRETAMACSDSITEPVHMDDLVVAGDIDMSRLRFARSSLGEKTSAIADDLIAYANGEPFDAELRMVLDDLIVDYAEGVLGPEAVLDLEACMRRSPNVARLVADMTAEFRLQVRFSMYYDDLLDPESGAELQRLIESDSDAARLARDMRIGGDLCRVMVQPIPYEMPLQAYNPLETMQGMLADGKLPYPGFADVIGWAEGKPADGRTEATFERLISDHIAGRLDEHGAKGLEAAMRLSRSTAWHVADHAERRSS